MRAGTNLDAVLCVTPATQEKGQGLFRSCGHSMILFPRTDGNVTICEVSQENPGSEEPSAPKCGT